MSSEDRVAHALPAVLASLRAMGPESPFAIKPVGIWLDEAGDLEAVAMVLHALAYGALSAWSEVTGSPVEDLIDAMALSWAEAAGMAG